MLRRAFTVPDTMPTLSDGPPGRAVLAVSPRAVTRHEGAMPELEHQQTPQVMSVIGSARLMLRDQLIDYRLVHKPSTGHTRRAEMVIQKLT